MPHGWQLRNFWCGNFQQERDKLLFDKHEKSNDSKRTYHSTKNTVYPETKDSPVHIGH